MSYCACDCVCSYTGGVFCSAVYISYLVVTGISYPGDHIVACIMSECCIHERECCISSYHVLYYQEGVLEIVILYKIYYWLGN